MSRRLKIAKKLLSDRGVILFLLMIMNKRS